MRVTILAVLSAFVAVSSVAVARGGGGGGRSHSYGSYSPGTGSSHSATYVRGHTTKNGTYVEGHYKSTPDRSFNNNWSTKGNDNPYTGKEGTRVTPPAGQQ